MVFRDSAKPVFGAREGGVGSKNLYLRILYQLKVNTKLFAMPKQVRKKKIKTSKLNEIMLPIFEKTPPPALKGKYVKIKYCVQLPTPSPQFVFFCNLPQYVKEAYKRFTENQLRKQFGFTGVPIEIYFRQKQLFL